MRCCLPSPPPSPRRWATAPSSSRSTGRRGTTSASRPSMAPTRAGRAARAHAHVGRSGSRSSTCASSAMAASCCRGTSSTGPCTSRSPSSPTSRWPTHPTPGIPRTRSSCRCATARGIVLGVMSVDEPVSGRRPSDDDLAVLAALAAHAALAVQDALAAAQAARHRTALEHLLRVSGRLTETLSIDAIMQEVCSGIRAALGFRNVSVEIIDAATQRAVPRAIVGWTSDEVAASLSSDVETLRRLLDREFEVEGCFLLPGREACARLGIERPAYESARNGSGPLAWDHHWLIIPLHDREGAARRGHLGRRARGPAAALDRAPAGAAHVRQPGRHRGRGGGGVRGDAVPRRERSAHRRRQPPRLHPAPGRGGPPRRALRAALRARRPGHRRLQGAQRLLRSLRGRHGARGDRRGAARHHAPLRQRLPPGRRRVRADPRERRAAGGDRRRRSHRRRHRRRAGRRGAPAARVLRRRAGRRHARSRGPAAGRRRGDVRGQARRRRRALRARARRG